MSKPFVRDIDATDRAILRLVQVDGGLTNVDLSARLNLSPSACLRRTRALEDAGLIARRVALLNEGAIGYAGVAFVQVTLDQQGRSALDRFEAAIERHGEILECYLLAGSADYMLRIAFRDTRDFERVHTDILTQLPGVSRVHSTLALRTVKRTTALPI